MSSQRSNGEQCTIVGFFQGEGARRTRVKGQGFRIRKRGFRKGGVGIRNGIRGQGGLSCAFDWDRVVVKQVVPALR